jgi:uncharacterized membrane protein YccC
MTFLKPNKWNDFSKLFRFDRLALSSAVRTVAAALVPLIIARLLGQGNFGLLMALAGLNVSRTDPGGPYRAKAQAMTLAILGVALSAFVATWASTAGWWAVPLVFVWGFAGGLAGGFGNTSAIVSFAFVQIFVITVGLPGGGPEAAPEHFLACLIGGLWAMVLSLWLWPLVPYRPIRESVADYYQAISKYIEEICRFSQDGKASEALTKNRSAAFEARHRATGFLISSRASRQGASRLSRNLLTLTVNGGELFDNALRLAHELEIATGHSQYEQVRPQVEKVSRELTAITARMSLLVRAGGGDMALENLEQAIAEFSDKVTGIRQQSVNLEADYASIVDFRNTVYAFENMAGIVRTATEIARDLEETAPPPRPAYSEIQFENRRFSKTLDTLRDNLTINSLIFRHALRLGLLTALAVTLYLALDLTHGYWITLTVVVILKPDFGGTFKRTYYRVIGTVVGGIVGAVLAATIHFDPLIYLLMAVLGVLAFAQLPSNYGLFVVLLTPFVILLIDLSQPGNWEVALIRILNTVVGGLLALAASYVFLPGWQRRFLPEQLGRTIGANRVYFGEVMAVYLGRELNPVRLLKARENANIETANAETAFQLLLSEPKRQQANVPHFYALVTYNRHFLDSMTTMAAHLPQFSGQHRLAGLDNYVARIITILEQLEGSVRRGEHPGQPPALEDSVRAVQAAMRKLSSSRIAELKDNLAGPPDTSNRQAIFDFAAVTRVMERLSQDISMMFREQNQVNPEE